MPRIERKSITIFDSGALRFFGIVLVLSALAIGGALFLGMHDTGTVDVNAKIGAADQSGQGTRVNQGSIANTVNGGLVPTNAEPEAPSAPPEPAPEAATTTASSTEAQAASTTPDGASATSSAAAQ